MISLSRRLLVQELVLIALVIGVQAMDKELVQGSEEKKERIVEKKQSVKNDELDTDAIVEYLQAEGKSKTEAGIIISEALKHIKEQAKNSFYLANRDPQAFAKGVLLVHNECLNYFKAGKTFLGPRVFLACALSDHLTLTEVELTLKDIFSIWDVGWQNRFLIKLDLYRVVFDENDKRFVLQSITSLPHLEELTIEESGITDDFFEAAEFGRLKKLAISKNGVTARGAHYLLQFKKLEALNLYKNPIGDAGASIIAKHPSLKELFVRQCGIGDEGGCALAKNSTLTALNLRDNNLTAASIMPLVKMLKIKILEVGKNPGWTQEVEDQLNARLSLAQNAPTVSRALMKSLGVIRILSIDGGQFGGLLPALLLQALTTRLKEAVGISGQSDRELHLEEHFDCIVGSSHGALIALLLTFPYGEGRHVTYTPERIVEIFTENRFQSLSFPHRLLHEGALPSSRVALMGKLFRSAQLAQAVCRCLVIALDANTEKVFTFDSEQAKKDAMPNFSMQDVALAVTAAEAPITVKSDKNDSHTFVDGILYAPNPALLALKRAKIESPQAKEYCIISLGAGSYATSKKDDQEMMLWLKNRYIDQILDCEVSEDPRVKYIRIQPAIDVKKDKSEKIAQAVQKALSQEPDALEAAVGELLKDFTKK